MTWNKLLNKLACRNFWVNAARFAAAVLSAYRASARKEAGEAHDD
jgi:hypothetical protein